MSEMTFDEAAERFVTWLDRQVTSAGRGEAVSHLPGRPSGYFWLGRLSPEDSFATGSGDERGERLSPCAVGIRILVAAGSAPEIFVRTSLRAWYSVDDGFRKTDEIRVAGRCLVPPDSSVPPFLGQQLADGLAAAVGVPGLSAELRVQTRPHVDGLTELTVLVVNTSPSRHPNLKDTNLYEVELTLGGVDTKPFLLTSLPDSYRYDRRVHAYGVNCGVERVDGGGFRTTDTAVQDRGRPAYWSLDSEPPDLGFDSLASDPAGPLQALHDRLRVWGQSAWSDEALAARAAEENWSEEMRKLAREDAAQFRSELARIEEGIELLRADDTVCTAFRLMNSAMQHSSRGSYDGWRPFQLGFLLANLRSLVDSTNDASTADVIWFATGGGKTETYLGLLVTAALLDRLQGRLSGMTAWSRFPLRMLSLQQTQRFADAMAGAELARIAAGIPGEPFSVGFFVGQGGTPNRIRPDPQHPWEPDPDDPDMPGTYRVLLTCPFCHEASVEMGFDRLDWCLEHRCTNETCPWEPRRLPFFVVDDEIYRFLPTVVVGTLDKAALVGFQASMRGFVGPPHGNCDQPGHGFTYAPRSDRPTGCLVPGCPGTARRIEEPSGFFGPRFRLQDELHLLTDSLGAVDAHYESLLDDLQMRLTGRRPKILASSATLTGYEHQVEVLYGREARVFPMPGPSSTESFWTSETNRLARRFVAVAPRAQTLEFTVDQMLTRVQEAIRWLVTDPGTVCSAAGIPASFADELVRQYGTTVVYGNTLRDLEAALRSSETQVQVVGDLNTATLTGRTPLGEVRQTLDRLKEPEENFDDRLHIVGASSMMSHGVDIDRLNVVLVLGFPLTTAEFIQATSRIGRRFPGLVYVLTKMARERDAAIYRSFPAFVKQGDRFVEPSPVTRRSRRVLERTLPGVELARFLAVHEPSSRRSIAGVRAFREFCEARGLSAAEELPAVIGALRLGDASEQMRLEAEEWLEEFFHNVADPPPSARFPSDLCPGSRRPMQSLRDVEEQAPVSGSVLS